MVDYPEKAVAKASWSLVFLDKVEICRNRRTVKRVAKIWLVPPIVTKLVLPCDHTRSCNLSEMLKINQNHL